MRGAGGRASARGCCGPRGRGGGVAAAIHARPPHFVGVCFLGVLRGFFGGSGGLPQAGFLPVFGVLRGFSGPCASPALVFSRGGGVFSPFAPLLRGFSRAKLVFLGLPCSLFALFPASQTPAFAFLPLFLCWCACSRPPSGPPCSLWGLGGPFGGLFGGCCALLRAFPSSPRVCVGGAWAVRGRCGVLCSCARLPALRFPPLSALLLRCSPPLPALLRRCFPPLPALFLRCSPPFRALLLRRAAPLRAPLQSCAPPPCALLLRCAAPFRALLLRRAPPPCAALKSCAPPLGALLLRCSGPSVLCSGAAREGDQRSGAKMQKRETLMHSRKKLCKAAHPQSRPITTRNYINTCSY